MLNLDVSSFENGVDLDQLASAVFHSISSFKIQATNCKRVENVFVFYNSFFVD